MERITPDLNATLLNTWGLSGKLFSPEPFTLSPKAVIVVGGSEGGLHERDAQVLAQSGFTVLALAYFGAPSVPPSLHDISLEYFSRAIDLLISLGAKPGLVGMLGGSRGGEAALAVAARPPCRRGGQRCGEWDHHPGHRLCRRKPRPCSRSACARLDSQGYTLALPAPSGHPGFDPPDQPGWRRPPGADLLRRLCRGMRPP